ncbi:MAG: hypothetical protein KIH01_01140 [Candidatus Freyarchaeota archaeon]|nr:hypothetical protein [Candidatus Jordarchaeia archaeon]
MAADRLVGMSKEDVKAFLEELQMVYREYFRMREHKTRDDLIILNNLARFISQLKRILQEMGGSA